MARAVARLGRFDVCVVRTPWGRIEYCESGRGEAVLLIHGVVGGWDGASTWRTQYQSIVPSVPTSAAVCRSPITPCSAMGR